MKKKELLKWINSLTFMEKDVMTLRFGLEGQEPLTLAEISSKLGIKKNKAKVYEITAINKLKMLRQNAS